MFEKKSPQVLVVGAGPVGLVATAALAARQVRVTVIEKQWGPATRSYALALHRRSLEILEELGLLDAVVADAHRIESIALLDDDGPKATLDLAELAGSFSSLLVLPQAALERHLVAHLEKQAHCRLLWSHRLRHLEVDGDGAHVAVDHLGKDSIGYGTASTGWVVDKVHRWSPRFVLGADGHGSTVRRDLEIELMATGTRRTYGVFECTAPGGGEGREMKIVLSSHGDAVYWPMGGDRFRWSFELGAEESAPRRHGKSRLYVGLGAEAYPHLAAERLQDLLAERAPWWDREVAEVEWSARLQFDRRLASSFGRGPAWLAGDAAHLDGPIGVRSMNAGLEEARDLAGAFARAFEGGEDQLTAWGRERHELWRSGRATGRGGVDLEDAADPWVEEHRERIADVLPAFGLDLDLMLRHLAHRA